MEESEWLSSVDSAAMLRFVTENPDHQAINCVRSGRKLRLFACSCVRQLWDRLTDDAPCAACHGIGVHRGSPPPGWVLPRGCLTCAGTGRVNRSRWAVEVAEHFADGEATETEMYGVGLDAWQHFVADVRGGPADNLVASAARCALAPIGEHAQAIVQNLQASAVPGLASLLRSIVGNPFRPAPSPWRVVRAAADMSAAALDSGASEELQPAAPWLTPTVRRLATAIDAAFPNVGPADFLALADALREAGLEETRREECPFCKGVTGYNACPGYCEGTGYRAVPNEPAVEILRHLEGWSRCAACLGTGEHERAGRDPGCPDCHGTGWRREDVQPVKGDWVIDLLLGKE